MKFNICSKNWLFIFWNETTQNSQFLFSLQDFYIGRRKWDSFIFENEKSLKHFLELIFSPENCQILFNTKFPSHHTSTAINNPRNRNPTRIYFPIFPRKSKAVLYCCQLAPFTKSNNKHENYVIRFVKKERARWHLPRRSGRPASQCASTSASRSAQKSTLIVPEEENSRRRARHIPLKVVGRNGKITRRHFFLWKKGGESSLLKLPLGGACVQTLRCNSKVYSAVALSLYLYIFV